VTRRARMILLWSFAIVPAHLLLVGILRPELLRDPRRPPGIEAEARWLMEHPADWVAASEISDAALDLQSPRRFQLWYTAYEHARRLAPHRANTAVAFVRGGLFHWYELGAADRKRVLDAAAPLMHDEAFFGRMYAPLWQLTRDFAWLRRVAPDTLNARIWLRDLAIVRGLFGDYRVLRDEIRRERMEAFDSRRGSDDPNALLELVPRHLDRADEPLVHAMLEELDRKAFNVEQMSGAIEDVVEFAVRHDTQPLAAIGPLVKKGGRMREVTRARAALALNDVTMATQIELTGAIDHVQEWSEYYLDRARFEARRGDFHTAEAYVLRAAPAGQTPRWLAVAEEVARAAGKPAEAAAYRKRLEAMPWTWSGMCGAEVCRTATATQYVRASRLQLQLANTQSDETPPYVEIYVDDALAAEGEVRDQRAFDVATTPGLHELEVRLVNPLTRNGAQRRVRLS